MTVIFLCTSYMTLYKTTYLHYYRFIVRFTIGSAFLFITFFLHFFLSWMSSPLSISSSAIFAYTLYKHISIYIYISTYLPVLILISTTKLLRRRPDRTQLLLVQMTGDVHPNTGPTSSLPSAPVLYVCDTSLVEG